MSPDHLRLSLSNKVEDLCQQGCQHVNNVIQKLEKKQPVEELNDFNDEERRQILTTLNDIMSVYADKNDK